MCLYLSLSIPEGYVCVDLEALDSDALEIK